MRFTRCLCHAAPISRGRVNEVLPDPPGFPSRAVALLAQAERMQAVLDLAADDRQEVGSIASA